MSGQLNRIDVELDGIMAEIEPGMDDLVERIDLQDDRPMRERHRELGRMLRAAGMDRVARGRRGRKGAQDERLRSPS